MYTILGVACYGWLVRWLERLRTILTEVHIKVCEILDNHNVILRSHTADDLQLLLVQAHPRRVVRVRVDHTADATRREYLLQLSLEGLATVVDNVERLDADALNLTLKLLNREAWVDEQNSITVVTHLRECRKCCEGTLHRAHRRHDADRRDIQVDEGLDEA